MDDDMDEWVPDKPSDLCVTDSLDLIETYNAFWFKNMLRAKGEKPNGAVLFGLLGKLLEEAVELALEGGMSVRHIEGHIADSIFNQCRKAKLWPTLLNKENTPIDLSKLNQDSAFALEVADVLNIMLTIKNLYGVSNKTLHYKLLLNRAVPPEKWHMSEDKLFYRKRIDELMGGSAVPTELMGN